MLQIGAALFYYKLGQTLLQIGAASLLQIRASVVTNWGSYYKLGQPLLQNKAAITNWGKMYCKLGQVLQVRAIITNWGMKLWSYEVSYSKKYQDHIPCSFVYKLVCVDDKFTNPIVVFRDENAAHEFVKAILRESMNTVKKWQKTL